jgi:hypothetical protein
MLDGTFLTAERTAIPLAIERLETNELPIKPVARVTSTFCFKLLRALLI